MTSQPSNGHIAKTTKEMLLEHEKKLEDVQKEIRDLKSYIDTRVIAILILLIANLAAWVLDRLK